MALPDPVPAAWKLGLARNPLLDGLHFLGWRTLFGCRLENLPNVQPGIPVIFAGNHGSHFDFFFLHEFSRHRLKRKGLVVVWDQMAQIPFVRLLVHGFDAIPVSRRREDRALKSMIRSLQTGNDLWVFPEGQRNETLGHFKPGAAAASLLTGRALIPFSLRGVQPLFKTLPWPRRYHGQVSIHFHAPLLPADYAARFSGLRAQTQAMTADLRAAVATAVDYAIEQP